MKTTIELSDDLFRRTKATAAMRGQNLNDVVAEALEEQLECAESVSPRVRGRCNVSGGARPEEVELAPGDRRSDCLGGPEGATIVTAVPETELRPVDHVDDIPRVTRALRQAVREALWQHKIAGNPVAVWRNGRVEWIPPEEIPVENPHTNDESDES